MTAADRLPDMEKVSAVMAAVAAEEIMPLYGHLSAAQIDAKDSGEIVTAADLRAEQRLGEELNAIYPGAALIGEESVSADPSLAQPLAGDGPLWIIDPLDGTRNFANGKPCFAVIVAFCRAGRTLAGWIHNPLDGQTASARLGEGAWMGGQRLRVAPALPISEMSGSMSRWRRDKLAETIDPAGLPARALRYGCVGMEYVDLARGALHFAEYGILKPWDHAAGLLIHAEAGGYAAFAGDETPYRPVAELHARLLIAPDKQSWRGLRDVWIMDEKGKGS